MGQERRLGRHERPIEVGRSDLDGNHAELTREEARKRDLELRIREEEDALRRQAYCAGVRLRLRPASAAES